MWAHDIAYFFGGLFLSNAIPHTVAGMMGRPFQSPFAKPRGEGYSTARVNFVWGFSNLVIAYALLRVGQFDAHSFEHVGVTMLGAFLIGVQLSGHFGRFNGGNDPDPQAYGRGGER